MINCNSFLCFLRPIFGKVLQTGIDYINDVFMLIHGSVCAVTDMCVGSKIKKQRILIKQMVLSRQNKP